MTVRDLYRALLGCGLGAATTLIGMFVLRIHDGILLFSALIWLPAILLGLALAQLQIARREPATQLVFSLGAGILYVFGSFVIYLITYMALRGRRIFPYRNETDVGTLLFSMGLAMLLVYVLLRFIKFCEGLIERT